MSIRNFGSHRDAALALLNGGFKISRKEGGFLGQIAVVPTPLSEQQAAWLAKMLERCDLPNW